MNNTYNRAWLTATFALFLACLTATAQVWTGSSNNNWHNAANWSPNVVPSTGSTASIPLAPMGGVFPTISVPTTVDFTVFNAGNITINANVNNTGSFVNFDVGCIVNNAQFTNKGSVTYDNDGKLVNNGTFNNPGNIDNAGTAKLINNAGAQFNNTGTIKNFGTVTNGGTVTNNGTIINTTIFQNNGVLNNYNYILNEIAANFYNNAGASLNNYGTMEIGGTFTNGGSLLNESSMSINSSGTLTNNGTLTNKRDVNNSGVLTNNKTINNYSFINNNFGGKIFNYDRINNPAPGTIEIFQCTELYQYSSKPIDGNVWNMGIVYQLGANVNTWDMGGVKLFNLSDKPKPVAICKNATVTIDANGQATISAADVDGGSKAEYCELGGIDVSPKSFTCLNVGSNTVTLTVRDYYGNVSTCTATVTVLTSAACGGTPGVEICTYTQGYYGNPGGIQNGKTTLQLIQSALSNPNGTNRPIILGTGQRTLTINYNAASCVIQLMPGGGTAAMLPKKNVVLGTNCDPSPIPVENGKFKNNLLSQTLALTISARNDSDLPGLKLSGACISFPASVKTALGENGTVADLLAYANRALGGQVAQDKLSDIVAAVDGINVYFDECKLSCPDGRSSSSDELLFLQANRSGLQIELRWLTNTEMRNDYFVIERSTDGVNFEAIAQIGNSTTAPGGNEYSLTDPEPSMGVNFYRVRQVYIGGDFSFSNLANAALGFNPNDFAVFPNPAQHELNVNLKEFAGLAGSVQVYNQMGKPMYSAKFDAFPAEPIIISLDGLNDGLYHLTVIPDNRRTMTKRFVVSKL